MTAQAFDLTSPAFKLNPMPTLTAMREQGPVLKAALPFIGEAWVTTTYEATVFDEPETFDISRSPNPHVAFKTGIHVCLGLKIAKAEVGIAFEQLFTRFPNLQLSIPPEEIQWWERLGHRAMKRLPVALNANVPISM